MKRSIFHSVSVTDGFRWALAPSVFRAPRLPIKLAVLFMTSASPRVNYFGPLVACSALLPPIMRLCVMLMRKASVEETHMPAAD